MLKLCGWKGLQGRSASLGRARPCSPVVLNERRKRGSRECREALLQGLNLLVAPLQANIEILEKVIAACVQVEVLGAELVPGRLCCVAVTLLHDFVLLLPRMDFGLCDDLLLLVLDRRVRVGDEGLIGCHRFLFGLNGICLHGLRVVNDRRIMFMTPPDDALFSYFLKPGGGGGPAGWRERCTRAIFS